MRQAIITSAILISEETRMSAEQVGMSWERLLSKKRFHRWSPDHYPIAKANAGEFGRSEFQKDFDRIVFCDSFRRLQRKTQVHTLPEDDNIHNRLTHSLEVCSVGRSLGEAIGAFLDERHYLPKGYSPMDVGAITQAACLAHDIGNPPFGHAGEYALRDWYRRHFLKLEGGHVSVRFGLKLRRALDVVLFEGNAQGFRILTQLENHRFEGGMRLTYAVLSAMCKYPWDSSSVSAMKKIGLSANYPRVLTDLTENQSLVERFKYGINESESRIFHSIASETGLISANSDKYPDQTRRIVDYRRNPLSYLVEVADDICYAIMDLEDGLRMKLISFSEYEHDSLVFLREALFERVEVRAYNSNKNNRTELQNVGALRGMLIQALVGSSIQTFKDKYDDIMNGQLSDDLTGVMTDPCRAFLRKAKLKGRDNIYSTRAKSEAEIGSYKTIQILCEALSEVATGLKNSVSESDNTLSNLDFHSLPLKLRHIISLMRECSPFEHQHIYHALLGVNDFISGLTDSSATSLARKIAGGGA